MQFGNQYSKDNNSIQRVNSTGTSHMREWIAGVSLFIISCLNEYALALALLFSLVYIRSGSVGSVKLMLLISLRTIMNPGLAVEIGNLQLLKWGVLFLAATNIYYISIRTNKVPKHIVKRHTPWFLFLLVGVISSLFISPFTIASLMKIVSYSYIYFAILIGVLASYERFDWLGWLVKWIVIIILSSLVLIPFPVGKLRNGVAFQGITNQPNMLGILFAYFTSALVVQLRREDSLFISSLYTLLILFTGVMTFYSRSRTGMLSYIIVLVLSVFIQKKIQLRTLFVFLFCSTSLAILFIISGPAVIEIIEEFIYKGDNPLLYSRSGQIDTLAAHLEASPLIGTGFGVPYFGVTGDASISELIVEPGNVVFAVLEYTGIIGFLLFLGWVINLIFRGRLLVNPYTPLLIAVFTISMGEMVFFSSNNIGTLVYFGLALYISSPVIHINQET